MCRDQRAVASLHGLAVGPISLSTTPVPLRNRALVTSGLHCANARASVASLAPALRYFLRPCPPRFGIAPLPSPTSQPKRQQRRASPLSIRLKSWTYSLWSIRPALLWRTAGKSSLKTNVPRGHPNAPARAKGALESVQRSAKLNVAESPLQIEHGRRSANAAPRAMFTAQEGFQDASAKPPGPTDAPFRNRPALTSLRLGSLLSAPARPDW